MYNCLLILFQQCLCQNWIQLHNIVIDLDYWVEIDSIVEVVEILMLNFPFQLNFLSLLDLQKKQRGVRNITKVITPTAIVAVALTYNAFSSHTVNV